MPQDQLTDAEETAMWMQREAEALLDEMPYVPALEIAQGLIDNPADLTTDEARSLAAVLRERARGSGVLKARPDPPPVKKPAPVAKKAAVRVKPEAVRLL